MQNLMIPIAAMTLFTGIANAASTVDLTVTGLITPMACTPVLSSGGLVDFGKISRNDLNPSTGTRLPHKYLTLTVNCNAPGRYALRMRDTADGLPTSTASFSTGWTGQQRNKIGVYSVALTQNKPGR